MARDCKARTYNMPKVTLKGFVEKIKDNVVITADAICADEGNFYWNRAGCIKNHNDQAVGHDAKEWVRATFTPRQVTGYRGLLKRDIIGSFHEVSTNPS